jgi:hypothetical protein
MSAMIHICIPHRLMLRSRVFRTFVVGNIDATDIDGIDKMGSYWSLFSSVMMLSTHHASGDDFGYYYETAMCRVHDVK